MRPQTRPRVLYMRSKTIFSIKEGAAYLGLSSTTLRRRIAAGRLHAYPWGKRTMLLRHDLDQYQLLCTSTHALAGYAPLMLCVGQ